MGVALQAYLHRTEDDIRRMNKLGARVRLVKGAYKEPAADGVQGKERRECDVPSTRPAAAGRGHYPAIATHDPELIDAVCAYATEQNMAQDQFEFQLLYGIRRDLQSLARRGRDFACASTYPSAANGFPTSCGGSASGRQTSAFVLKSLLAER